MKNTVVQYKDLSRWDVKSFLNTLKAPFPVVKLWNYIYEHSEKENIFTEKEKEFSILWVTNKVWIYLNEIKKWKEINQPYKKVLSWEIAYNPYRVNVGSIWIVQEEYNNYYISPAYVVFWTNEKLYNKYLYLILSSSWYNDFLRAKTSGSVRQNLTFNLLSDLEIPLPKITTQKQIVEEYENNKKQAQNMRNEALEKEKNIDDFLMSELGIEKQEQKKKKWPFIVRFKDLERWDVSFFRGIEDNYRLDFVTIWSIFLEKNNTKIIPKKDKEYLYIGLENIEKNTWLFNFIDANDIKSQSILLKKWYIYYSKLRPYLNKAFLFLKDGDNFIATSELFWFKVKSNIDNKYIIYILLSKIVLEQIKKLMIWARMPRISEKDFFNLRIPLPPIWDKKTPWTQKYIVSKIDEMKQEIDSLNTKAEKLEKEADENLEKAILWA